MIISASRRTDIPAFYTEWFLRRIDEQYLLVRNPMNIHQVSRINLSPDVIDGFVFWTKNPVPIMPHLHKLEKYPFYFQFTLTAYDRDVEPGLPSKNEILIPAFQSLSKRIGREKVVWRYDPIFFNQRYTPEYHCRYFRILATKLCDYTEKCTVSFIDMYRNTEKNTQVLDIARDTTEQRQELMYQFSEIAKQYGLIIDTCSEIDDFSICGIKHACCIDKERFERIGKYKLEVKKDSNQRAECGCIASIDIGAYNTCRNGCLYCYANYNHSQVQQNAGRHDPSSPLLFGEIGPEDVVKDRNVISLKVNQISLFD